MESPKLKEATIALLLAEYDRQKNLEQFRLSNYESALQFYLTIISTGLGVLIFLLEGQESYSSLHLKLIVLLVSVLIMGEITFLRLMGLDIALGEHAKAYIMLRKKFMQSDPELKKVFLKGLVHNEKKYRSWSSFPGIILRVFTRSQHKTTVVLINCLIAGILGTMLLHAQANLVTILSFLLGVTLLGCLHVIYSSWRYKLASKLLANDEIEFWV